MSEGRSRGVGARRFSGGGGRGAVSHATPPPTPPLTRSRSDQNTTSRSSKRAGGGASTIEQSGLEGSDGSSDQDVTSAEAGISSSWQVVTRLGGEKKGLSPGELTGSSVLERTGCSGQLSGQLIGKPVTHVPGLQVVQCMYMVHCTVCMYTVDKSDCSPIFLMLN